MKISIASDTTFRHELEISGESSKLSPIEIAYKYGRGESNEIVWIYNNNNTSDKPDAYVCWDQEYRKYREYNPNQW